MLEQIGEKFLSFTFMFYGRQLKYKKDNLEYSK